MFTNPSDWGRLAETAAKLEPGQSHEALIRAGGVEVAYRGKGSHKAILMPTGHVVILPVTLKVGLLAGQIKAAHLTIEEFIDLLNGDVDDNLHSPCLRCGA